MIPLACGILGGSFDPPHYGHLALAETARAQLGLARVLFVPAGAPPHKRDVALSSVEERVAMVRLAVADNAAFEVSCIDAARPGPDYTADTLALVAGQHPEVARWYFLMGEDSLRDFLSWRDPAAILERATLAVMPRGEPPADVDALVARLPQLAERLVWLDVPPIDYAATDLRRRARRGLPLRYLVPPAVAAYIRERALYSAG